MFIIIGLIVGLLVLFAEQMLNGGPRIGDEEESWMTLSEVDVSGWVKAILAAVICGIVRYVIPSIDGKSPLIVVLYIALVVMLVILCREWHYNVESDMSELIPFLILAVIFGGLLIKLNATSIIGNAVVQAIMSWLAYALACVTILYIIVRHLAVNHGLRWLVPAFCLVAAVAVVWSGIGVTQDALAMMAKGAKQSTETTTEEPVPEDIDEVDEVEDSRFVQKWTSNENNRLDNDFSAKLAKKAEDGEITAEMVEETVLENCGHDARMLAIWANAFGLYENPNEYAPLVNDDKTYLSEEGIELYHKLEGYLAATKIVREEAPADGTNTGYDDGYVASESAGITGDRTGTKFTSPDENVEQFWLMDRCSNLVYKKTPNVPKGKTDEPKKPGKGDSPTPTPKYKKDPSKAPKKNTEPNDDKGPGPNTNNPSNPNRSTKDTNDSSSNSGKSYEDYKKDVKEKADTNKTQKTGNDSNTPSTPKPSPSTKVDNNADKGTGNGGINTPTPTKEKAKEADTGKTINDKAGEEWGGPSD